ncbi:MAG: hypothetical protein M3N98_08445 [Actinomycetota bacterium]|nr:hypothetical protein [Actinomycetota bacterium]
MAGARRSREKATFDDLQGDGQPDGETIDVFGGGATIRPFVVVEHLVEAVVILTRSSLDQPTKIGGDQDANLRKLVETVAVVAGIEINIRSVDEPLGVQTRTFSHMRIHSLGWSPRHSGRDAISTPYPWVERQVRTELGPAKRSGSRTTGHHDKTVASV